MSSKACFKFRTQNHGINGTYATHTLHGCEHNHGDMVLWIRSEAKTPTGRVSSVRAVKTNNNNNNDNVINDFAIPENVHQALNQHKLLQQSTTGAGVVVGRLYGL